MERVGAEEADVRKADRKEILKAQEVESCERTVRCRVTQTLLGLEATSISQPVALN